MKNPFETIQDELRDIKSILNSIQINSNKEFDEYYSIEEAASLLKVDHQTIRRHLKKGTLKAKKIGRRIRIPKAELFDNLGEVKSLRYKR